MKSIDGGGGKKKRFENGSLASVISRERRRTGQKAFKTSEV